MNRTDTLDLQTARMWADTTAWFSSHSLQILLGLAAGTAIVLVLMGARWIGLRLCRSDPTHTHWRTVFGRMLERTRLWFMLALAARVVVGVGQAPEPWGRITQIAFIVAAALQVALWVRELALGVIEHRAGAHEDSSGLGSAMGIIRLLVSVAIFAVALVVVLDNLGVNVTGLIAGLGIGGIAIGLAAQGIFKDLFAALAIIFDRPFRRGDLIRFADITGHVEEIGLKSTRIRSDSGQQVVVSNAILLDKEVHNFALVARRRVQLPFGLIYQTDPKTLAQVPEIVRAIVEQDNRAKLVRCTFLAFGTSSLDFELLFDVPSADPNEVAAVRAAIGLDILKAFDERGIAFAYPSQVAFTAAPDGRLIMPYPEAPKT
ncbi:mechanosensitive ion channel family protein [Sphingosinicella sp.]|uniref:mechanosensitive ion channel family protein n=1 Tax=Sphingosinicella sp. TaxID=1917971 RepID=UPI004037A995